MSYICVSILFHDTGICMPKVYSVVKNCWRISTSHSTLSNQKPFITRSTIGGTWVHRTCRIGVYCVPSRTLSGFHIHPHRPIHVWWDQGRNDVEFKGVKWYVLRHCFVDVSALGVVQELQHERVQAHPKYLTEQGSEGVEDLMGTIG